MYGKLCIINNETHSSGSVKQKKILLVLFCHMGRRKRERTSSINRWDKRNLWRLNFTLSCSWVCTPHPSVSYSFSVVGLIQFPGHSSKYCKAERYISFTYKFAFSGTTILQSLESGRSVTILTVYLLWQQVLLRGWNFSPAEIPSGNRSKQACSFESSLPPSNRSLPSRYVSCSQRTNSLLIGMLKDSGNLFCMVWVLSVSLSFLCTILRCVPSLLSISFLCNFQVI